MYSPEKEKSAAAAGTCNNLFTMWGLNFYRFFVTLYISTRALRVPNHVIYYLKGTIYMKQFQAESKRLLDLMIHSIYTHKEIFLRELISNASDAIDKLHFKTLTDQSVEKPAAYEIRLTLDKENRLLTVRDNGIGMTREELENNLGVIAKSGSLAFKQENQQSEDVDIIGQFGVGFYASFMVASKVVVRSKACGASEAWQWESEGAEGYEVTPCEKADAGTEILLYIKQAEGEESYDEFLDPYRISNIIKKYSDYIRYPIKMDMPRSRMKEKPADAPEDYKPEYEEYMEETTLNSMLPLWKKDKKDITAEEYQKFYQEKFFDYQEPLAYAHVKTEGVSTYNALLFIPKKPPFDYYTKDFLKGLQLYASGVLIMDKCDDLLPDYFSFVRGLVDSQDLSLNISREILQQDRQLRLIAGSIEKKIKSELLKLLKDDREKYDEFWKSFGPQIKVGVYADYGANKDKLRDLLMFYSAAEKKNVTLQEYLDKMPEGQEFIYYAGMAGDTAERIDKLPQTELVRDHGFDILYLMENIDEFAIRTLGEFEGKKFKNISEGDLGLTTDEEKKKAEELASAHKDMFDFMKEALNGKVHSVRLSNRLKSHPVCLSTEGGLSLEMEKVLNAMPVEDKVSAQKILELNGSHPIFKTLCALYDADKDKLKQYTSLLYTQALLIEGLPVEDPVAFTNDICSLMAQ